MQYYCYTGYIRLNHMTLLLFDYFSFQILQFIWFNLIKC